MHRTAGLSPVLAAFLACIIACGPAMADGLQEALRRAGNNAPEIRAFLAQYPDGKRREAAEFLVEALPAADAVSMSAKELSANLDYAFLARDSMPWGRDCSFGDFLRFVLPHRAAQEPAQAFRPSFYKELVPLLQGVRDAGEAALRINRWAFGQAGFRTTSRWDQGPLDLMRSGFGRCEELAVLVVDALRSVGIPARTALIPRWRHTGSNHLWIEVLVDGNWRFLEPGAVDSDFGLAWFLPNLYQAPAVYTLVYGNATRGLPEKEVYKAGNGHILLNRTTAYLPEHGRAAVSLTDEGEPAPQAEVAFWVFNTGGLQRVATPPLNAEGRAEALLGPGRYLVTAADETGVDHDLATVEAGETTEVRLDISRRNDPEGVFELRYPSRPEHEAEMRRMFKSIEERRASLKSEIAARRERELVSLAGAVREALAGEPQELLAAAAKAGGNAPEVARALALADAEIREVLRSAIPDMAHKDLAVFEAPELVANAASALAARKRLAAEGVEYPDELFVRWLLPERLLFEPFSHWRSRLPGVVKKPESYVLQDVLAVFGEELAGIELVEEAFPGPVVRPVEIISSGRARSEKEVLYAAAALLRLFGLPARLYADWPVLEYFDGDSWRIFEPELENLPEIPRDFRAAAELRLAFTENGDRIGEEKSRYFRDFTISSYEKGVFEVLKAPFGEYLEQDKAWIFRLPPGEYAVVAGERSDGLVRVGVEILELPAGGRRSRTMALDL